GRAHSAGLSRWAIHAVQASRNDSCNRGFPGPALPGQDVPVRNPALRNSVLQSGSDMLLADELRELGRPVFPRDDLVHESALIVTGLREVGICQTPGDPRHTS